MTALWTVTVLLAILLIANSVAVVALGRQVGLLHQRAAPPQRQEPPSELRPGSRLQLDVARLIGADPTPDLVLLGFVRPSCSHCAAVLPAFAATARALAGNERVLLVSDAGEAQAREYLAAHGVSLPVATDPHVIRMNAIPAIPYAVVADAAGIVLAAENATSTQQLAALMSQARQTRTAA